MAGPFGVAPSGRGRADSNLGQRLFHVRGVVLFACAARIRICPARAHFACRAFRSMCSSSACVAALLSCRSCYAHRAVCNWQR
eukprot:7058493-Pyramimonas_sp.AAC.1